MQQCLYAGGNTDFLGEGGNSTKKCDHDCDQALIKAAGDLYSIHILVSLCFGYIGVSGHRREKQSVLGLDIFSQ